MRLTPCKSLPSPLDTIPALRVAQPAIGNHRKPPNPNAGRRSNRHFLMRLEIAVTSSKQSIDYRPNRNIWDPPTDSKCPGGDAKLAPAFWIYLPSQEQIFG